jgi:hypothetical protein
MCMLYLCKFVIFRIKLKGNLLACRSLSPWHASLPDKITEVKKIPCKVTTALLYPFFTKKI